MEQNIALALALVTMSAALGAFMQTRRRLNALRKNCFVTNERGHRTRYANASPEARAKAETP